MSRNAYGQHTVVPYAVRARPGAPVAAPLDLEELDDPTLNAQRWRLRNIRRRIGQRADPWSKIRRHATTFTRARRALTELRSPH